MGRGNYQIKRINTYENSMTHVLKNVNYSVQQQHPISVCFEDIVVGKYFADLLVNDVVIAELKAAEAISKNHEAQVLNYLKATQIEVGLLLNFGKKPEFKRRAFLNSIKQSAFSK